MGETQEHDPLWLYRQDDPNPIERLAKEIGADFAPSDESRKFKVTWVKGLAVTVGKFSTPWRYKYPDDIAAWVKQIVAADAETLAFESVLIRVHREISAKDCDDGWAVDEAGAALERVTLTMQPNSRWLAHGAGHVWDFITGCRRFSEVTTISRKAWLRHHYEQCRNALNGASS